MKIVNDIKLDFDDVLLVPQRSQAASRASVSLERNFSFYHSTQTWKGIPICAANMDSTGTFAMSNSLQKYEAITCLHKHYKVEDYVENITDLNYAWYSMGIQNEELDKLNSLINKIEDIPNLCIDVANGYTDNFVNFCKQVRKMVGARPIIMAGNICTPEMVQELILHGGVDIVKVGIGPGSACTTRLKTGIGYPQLSAIDECSHAAHGLKSGNSRLGLICADGGCRTPSDVVKAFAAGADFVMLGGMLAGTDECEGEWTYDKHQFKTSLSFYGMSSHIAQEKYGGIKDYRASEGRSLSIPYKGPVKEIIDDILGGMRSACAYTGANKLKDLSRCAEFIRVNRVHFDKSV